MINHHLCLLHHHHHDHHVTCVNSEETCVTTGCPPLRRRLRNVSPVLITLQVASAILLVVIKAILNSKVEKRKLPQTGTS